MKGSWPKIPNGRRNKVYSPYGNAKDDLFEDIGEYCSFCESYSMSSSLAVEHIKAKNYRVNGIRIYAHLEENWNNFLISCVHCNSIKGISDVNYNRIHMPNRNNTYFSFEYTTGGLVIINNNLSHSEMKKAQKLMDLVGLDRVPGTNGYSSKDKRWKYRKEAWDLANKFLLKYNEGKIDADIVSEFAKQRGYWSIWMTVFKGIKRVEKALIKKFKGTYPDCRETDVNRNPIP